MTPPTYAEVLENHQLQVAKRNELIVTLNNLEAEVRRTRVYIIASERIIEQYEHMLKELSGVQEKA